MPQSTCIKCGGHNFELRELKVAKAKFKLFAIQCSSCGGVIGMQEYMNTSALLLQQNKALRQIGAKLGVPLVLET
jgi:hypothetical protein